MANDKLNKFTSSINMFGVNGVSGKDDNFAILSNKVGTGCRERIKASVSAIYDEENIIIIIIIIIMMITEQQET